MSRKLDLRTGRPVWMAYRAASTPHAPLTRDVRADVLVVGMGISGAMIAEALSAAGHSVIAIDRRGPLKGSTPATTALVQFEIDQPLTTLSRMIGRDRAERGWRRSRLALGNLKSTIVELGIACDLTERNSIYLAGDTLGQGELREEAEARRRAGLKATYLTAGALQDAYGIVRDGAIVSHDNLSLDPRKLTVGLLGKALERGARLYAPVEAIAFRHSADGVEAETERGAVIRAGHVVLATGYELAPGVPDKGHEVISTWAIATKPQRSKLWPGEAFVWEASDPYLYMRTTKDGRVICGGEDEEFTDEEARDVLIGAKTERIAAKLKRLMPALDVTPEFAWAGAFGSTATGLPMIDTLPHKPRIHAVMGYGGNGITWSRIAAEVVSTAIGGGNDSDADLFAFAN